MAVRNIKLTIVYDGSAYHGWQIQPGKKTIQGMLTEAIQELIGCKVQVFGASRTDAGVSALGQVALVQIDSPIPTENLARAITDRLACDIAVAEAVEVPDGFDVIGAVKSKLYRYTIFTGRLRPVLQIKHCWHLPEKLNIAAMAEAAKLLVGKRDFKSFASASDRRESSVRTIFRCDVTRGGHICHAERSEASGLRERDSSAAPQNDSNDWVYIETEGDGFLYNMVRNIVGTFVEVGIGRWSPERIKDIIASKNRTAAGPIAPAAGLCLMWIKY